MISSSQPFFYYRVDESQPAPSKAASAHPVRDAKESPVGASAHGLTERPMQAAVSTFERLYESIDHRLCMFETKEGHLACVQASRLV